MSAPELRSFHIGMVVHSIDKAIEQYSAILDATTWHRRPWRFNGLEIAYGRGAGQTFEFFQVTGPGDSHVHQFYAAHGEGVQHIGFWVDDVVAATKRAVEAGADLMTLTADAEGVATATLIPPPSVTANHLETLGMVTYVNPVGGVMIEYVGPAGEDYLRDWFKDDFTNVVIPPPWSS